MEDYEKYFNYIFCVMNNKILLTYFNFYQFLSSMNKRGIIEVKEFPKGVENLTGIKFDHEDVKSFVVDKVSIVFCICLITSLLLINNIYLK